MPNKIWELGAQSQITHRFLTRSEKLLPATTIKVNATSMQALPQAVFSMGLQTYKVPVDALFGTNRRKLLAALRMEEHGRAGVVLLQGGPSTTRFDSDHEPLFRQESYFWYLTGVKEPDCSFALDVVSGKSYLFIPRLPASYATIMGRIKAPAEWKQEYLMDEVFYIDEMESTLLGLLQSNSGKNGTHHPTHLLLMQGLNTDSGKVYELPTIDNDKLLEYVNTGVLFPILAECRVIKSETELQVIRHVTQVTSFAHAYVMRNMKPGMMEYQGESLFRHYCYYNYGCRLVGYTPICGCGPNAAVLHYGHSGEPNSRQSDSGDICLFDMGAEYFGYGSDVTCSFPVSGGFSDRQRPIFEAVLHAQIAVYKMVRPGVCWTDCHKAAERAILNDLIEIGLVVIGASGKSIDELVEMRLGAVFMPHGLGHFIGIDTHDVGGYLGSQARNPLPGLKSLRTNRILQKNMTLTVEPGCYFIDHLLDEAMADDSPLKDYLDATKIKAYRGFGGVRLEDVIVITESGCINYTLCPRTIAEIESVMAGGKWPPIKDEAPELCRANLTDPSPLPSPPSL